MKTLNFNSAICTSHKQSERLLALGLKKETADMGWVKLLNGDGYAIAIAEDYSFIDIPAWSLHRLIEMLNDTQFGMTIGIYRDEVTFAEDLFEVYDNTYDNLISVIEWLIGLGKFNKEYLTQ